MPIELSTPIHVVSQDEYHAIDRVMYGHAMAVHNEYGRLFDEAFYKSEVADRCRSSGLEVKREVLIRVRHGIFSKDYFIDLLLNDSTVVEGKCAQVINSQHHGQTLNYLLLAGTHHGSLVNFRTAKVKREFVSTRLTPEQRRLFAISRHRWPLEDRLRQLEELAVGFCEDVGLGLDLTLYRQAFSTLLAGGPDEPVTVPIYRGHEVIHEHPMLLISDDTALAVTAMPKIPETRIHLQRLLDHTRLKGIAWINLPLGELRFEFLERQNHAG